MANEIEHYFQNLKNPKHHDDLQRLREFVKVRLPEADEYLTYNMPTYMQNDQVIVAIASQRHYMSLYMDTALVERHQAELSDLDCGKSCIRFKNLDELPLEVIGLILQETVERQTSSD